MNRIILVDDSFGNKPKLDTHVSLSNNLFGIHAYFYSEAARFADMYFTRTVEANGLTYKTPKNFEERHKYNHAVLVLKTKLMNRLGIEDKEILAKLLKTGA